MVRPTANEQVHILTGKSYDNLGNCGGTFAVRFTGVGEINIIVDFESTIDWGDGNVIVYPPHTTITGTPIGDAYIISENAGVFSFPDQATSNIQDWEFINADLVVTLANVFENMPNLRVYTFSGECNITDYTEAFAGSSITEYVGKVDQYIGVENLTNMFKDTASLVKVNAMNTIDGLNFEGMFENSSVQCIQEINTCRGNFPKNTIGCGSVTLFCGDTSVKECNDNLLCDDDFYAGNWIACDAVIQDVCTMLVCNPTEYLDLFSNSTMFDNSNPSNPITSERDKIMNRYHYVGSASC